MLDMGAYAPVRAHKYDAGWDLRMPYDQYSFHNEYSIEPHKSLCINTGIHVQIPEGYVGIIVPRSSTGIKGYTIKNTIGVIDSDYRGEIKLHLFVPVTQKIRIAQMLIMPCPQFNIEFVESLSETDRGEGGFGSTGE